MTPSEWKSVQRRLTYLGFNPGPIDGIRGRLTTNAVRIFQASRGLTVDGIVGPQTHAALFGARAVVDPPSLDTYPWFDEANNLVGLTEVRGPGSNPRILDMAEALDIDYAGDDIPWCGLFVAHCIGSTLPMEALPAVALRARAWERFGLVSKPQLGAVMVFWRKTRSSGFGHVGFYAGEDSTHFHILGGNQSDQVNIRRFTRDRFLTARWPLTGPEATDIVLSSASDILETTGEQ